MIERNKPHFHVFLEEDDQYIASFQTPAEARRAQKQLRLEGWQSFTQRCGTACPLLFDRPFDRAEEKR